MNFRTVIRFQFGQADAVEAVARSRASLFTGLALVLLTAIPRNYDQIYFLESPFWLFGPLIFSFFSGTFLFSILYPGFIHRHLEAPQDVPTRAQWRCFMALFWMTAPVAWLYAIPVERFLNSYRAAQANLLLLAIVSLWRVLLMARIISVLQKIRFIRAVGWVLIPAGIEVFVLVFAGGMFSPGFGRHIMVGMGGMRFSPEEELTISAMNNVLKGTLILLPAVLVLLGVRRFQGTVRPFPDPIPDHIPVAALSLLAAIWIGIAVAPQFEQYRFATHRELVEADNPRESINYLALYGRKGFPASRRIEPSPYEYQVWERLPKVMAALQPTDPEWVRRLYLDHMRVLFTHRWLHCTPTALLQMFSAVERLPEGKDWIERNRSGLSKLRTVMERGPSDTADPATVQTAQQLTNVLERLGVDPNKPGEQGNPQR